MQVEGLQAIIALFLTILALTQKGPLLVLVPDQFHQALKGSNLVEVCPVKGGMTINRARGDHEPREEEKQSFYLQ